MALTTEQLLILNNLMYMSSGPDSPMVDASSYEGKAVSEWLNNIDISRLDDNVDYGNFTTGKDWKNIIQAARNDETIMSMTVATTYTDNAGGGGKSGVLINSSTNDAVVVFQGTAGGEWKDNFIGGNLTDTPCQENALEWYQSVYKDHGLEGYEITMTGHSKGGNKSKYITLLDNTVDHCVSFDGQGFSDEFMVKYANQIAARQGKIENHNVDYDFVNLLLNDVGKQTFYHGQDYGSGEFMENHCPNTFMNFHEDGTFTIDVNPNGQASEMAAMDEFLNSMLRSMPTEQRTQTLELLGTIADNFLGSNNRTDAEKFDIILELILDPEYSDDTAYLFAYMIEYEQAHPEFKDHINSVLTKFGMEDMTQYVDLVDEILNFNMEIKIGPFSFGTVDFDMLYGLFSGLISGVSSLIPDWLLSWIKDRFGIDLTVDQLRSLIKMIGMVNDDMQKIKIRDDGSDIKISSITGNGAGVKTHGRLAADIPRMRAAAEEFLRVADLLERAGGEVKDVAESLHISQQGPTMLTLRASLLVNCAGIEKSSNRARIMSDALSTVTRKYESTESNILTIF